MHDTFLKDRIQDVIDRVLKNDQNPCTMYIFEEFGSTANFSKAMSSQKAFEELQEIFHKTTTVDGVNTTNAIETFQQLSWSSQILYVLFVPDSTAYRSRKMYRADMKTARDSMQNLATKRFHGAPRILVIGDPTYFHSISNSVDVYATETNPEELAEAILEQIAKQTEKNVITECVISTKLTFPTTATIVKTSTSAARSSTVSQATHTSLVSDDISSVQYETDITAFSTEAPITKKNLSTKVVTDVDYHSTIKQATTVAPRSITPSSSGIVQSSFTSGFVTTGFEWLTTINTASSASITVSHDLENVTQVPDENLPSSTSSATIPKTTVIATPQHNQSSVTWSTLTTFQSASDSSHFTTQAGSLLTVTEIEESTTAGSEEQQTSAIISSSRTSLSSKSEESASTETPHSVPAIASVTFSELSPTTLALKTSSKEKESSATVTSLSSEGSAPDIIEHSTTPATQSLEPESTFSSRYPSSHLTVPSTESATTTQELPFTVNPFSDLSPPVTHIDGTTENISTSEAIETMLTTVNEITQTAGSMSENVSAPPSFPVSSPTILLETSTGSFKSDLPFTESSTNTTSNVSLTSFPESEQTTPRTTESEQLTAKTLSLPNTPITDNTSVLPTPPLPTPFQTTTAELESEQPGSELPPSKTVRDSTTTHYSTMSFSSETIYVTTFETASEQQGTGTTASSDALTTDNNTSTFSLETPPPEPDHTITEVSGSEYSGSETRISSNGFTSSNTTEIHSAESPSSGSDFTSTEKSKSEQSTLDESSTGSIFVSYSPALHSEVDRTGTGEYGSETIIPSSESSTRNTIASESFPTEPIYTTTEESQSQHPASETVVSSGGSSTDNIISSYSLIPSEYKDRTVTEEFGSEKIIPSSKSSTRSITASESFPSKPDYTATEKSESEEPVPKTMVSLDESYTDNIIPSYSLMSPSEHKDQATTEVSGSAIIVPSSDSTASTTIALESSPSESGYTMTGESESKQPGSVTVTPPGQSSSDNTISSYSLVSPSEYKDRTITEESGPERTVPSSVFSNRSTIASESFPSEPDYTMTEVSNSEEPVPKTEVSPDESPADNIIASYSIVSPSEVDRTTAEGSVPETIIPWNESSIHSIIASESSPPESNYTMTTESESQQSGSKTAVSPEEPPTTSIFASYSPTSLSEEDFTTASESGSEQSVGTSTSKLITRSSESSVGYTTTPYSTSLPSSDLDDIKTQFSGSEQLESETTVSVDKSSVDDTITSFSLISPSELDQTTAKEAGSDRVTASSELTANKTVVSYSTESLSSEPGYITTEESESEQPELETVITPDGSSTASTDVPYSLVSPSDVVFTATQVSELEQTSSESASTNESAADNITISYSLDSSSAAVYTTAGDLNSDKPSQATAVPADDSSTINSTSVQSSELRSSGPRNSETLESNTKSMATRTGRARAIMRFCGVSCYNKITRNSAS